MSLLDTASLVITPNGTKASTLYSVVPSDGSGDMTVTRATTATRVNSAGLIESVASNVPRLDYSNGTCPSILVEPQRTNLVTWSEDFTNASWTKSSGTMTANATVSPDGTSNAEEWISDGGGGFHDFYPAFTGGANTTSSIYVKKNTAQFVYISLNHQGSGTDWATGVYNLDNLTTATFQAGGVTSPIASIKDVGNGWRKITLSVSTANTNLYCMYGIANSLNPTFGSRGRIAFTTSASFYAWGAQLEAGSYATSYIPTTSASVTRNGDVISKTGISSLIGQTEGTLFVDFYHDGLANFNLSSISNGVYNDAVYFEMYLGNMYAVIWDSGSQQFAYNGGSLSVGRHKMAIGYKANDVVFYIDGVLKTTDTSATIPTTARVDVGALANATIEKTQNNLTALWKTRLTNAQLAQLTTI